jgi:hypothetical protein
MMRGLPEKVFSKNGRLRKGGKTQVRNVALLEIAVPKKALAFSERCWLATAKGGKDGWFPVSHPWRGNWKPPSSSGGTSSFAS